MKNLPAWFFDKADWQEKIFENEFVFIPTNNLTRSNLNYLGGEIKNIHYGDILTKFNNVLDASSNEIPFVNLDVDLKNKIYLQDGDIIFADTAEDYTAGKVIEIKNVNKNLLVSGLHTIACRPRKKFANGFLGYYLNSNQFRSQILPLIVGIKVMSISKPILQKTILKVPCLDEQKKIADYFSSLDNAINAQDLKLKSWRDAKKALLQKIFSQEFYFTQDNGEKYPAWQEKNLGELLQKSTNKSSEKILEAYSVNNKLGLVRQGEFFEDSRYARLDKSANKIVCPNEFVYNPARINVGSIAYNGLKKSVRVSPLYIIFKTTEQIEDKFLWQYFQTKKFFDEMKIKLEGSVRFCLNFENLCSMKIKIPCIEEQKKIADYFSSLDKIIDAENKMLESLRLMKRGLLQKLFI